MEFLITLTIFVIICYFSILGFKWFINCLKLCIEKDDKQ